MSKRLNKRQMRELEELQALKAVESSTPVHGESKEEEEEDTAPAFNPFAAVSRRTRIELTPARGRRARTGRGGGGGGSGSREEEGAFAPLRSARPRLEAPAFGSRVS